MGAYRLLSLTRDYFRYLNEERNWQRDLLQPANWPTVVRTLLIVYDRSLAEILDMPSFSYDAFFELLPSRDLCAFAIENYYCAEHLIQSFFTKGQVLNPAQDEYPLARAIVGLLAGVLEAILSERLLPCVETQWADF